MSTIMSKIVNTENFKNYKVNIEMYTDLSEMVHHCDTRSITNSYFKDMKKIEYGSFESVGSYDEALDLLKNGYKPTVTKLKEKLGTKNMAGTRKRVTFQNDVHGFTPVVPMALMGMPNSMIDTRMSKIKCKVVDIYYDMTCSCGTESSDIIKNGQKLLGAVMDLEAQGYKFNLYAVQSYTGDNDADFLAIKIKSSNKPLDLKKMSFPLTHTAFFRVMGFDWYSKMPKGKYRNGYGRALSLRINNKNELQDFAEQCFGDNIVFISCQKIIHEDEQHIKDMLLMHER